MHIIGFSTGNIRDRAIETGVAFARRAGARAIELSALREHELDHLMVALDRLDLSGFDHISVHAPSRLERLGEAELVAALRPAFDRGYPVVVHPNIVATPDLWRPFGGLVLIENMDKRKPGGRTADELDEAFEALPDAGLCFDIAHARQVDPTMYETLQILRRHSERIRQIHISELDSRSGHGPVTLGALLAYKSVLGALPSGAPFIFESPVQSEEDARRAIGVIDQLFRGYDAASAV